MILTKKYAELICGLAFLFVFVHWYSNIQMLLIIKITTQLPFKFMTNRAQLVQISGIVIGMVSIDVIDLSHTFGPIRNFSPFYHTPESKMPISIAAFASLKRCNSRRMGPATV